MCKNKTTDFVAGCLIGWKCQCFLSDGTMVLCRRFPEIIGRLPEDSFEEIYLTNEKIKKYRRPQYFENCGSCIGWNYCRGCPAISNGEYKNPYKKPSICFAHLLDIDTHIEHTPVTMDTTLKEEADLIVKNSRQNHYKLTSGQGFSIKVLRVIRKLKRANEYTVFSENPGDWFSKNASELSTEEQSIVLFHYNRRALGFIDRNNKWTKWST